MTEHICAAGTHDMKGSFVAKLIAFFGFHPNSKKISVENGIGER